MPSIRYTVPGTRRNSPVPGTRCPRNSPPVPGTRPGALTMRFKFMLFLIAFSLMPYRGHCADVLDRKIWVPYSKIYEIRGLQVRPVEIVCAKRIVLNGKRYDKITISDKINLSKNFSPVPPVLMTIDIKYMKKCAVFSRFLAENRVCDGRSCYYRKLWRGKEISMTGSR